MALECILLVGAPRVRMSADPQARARPTVPHTGGYLLFCGQNNSREAQKPEGGGKARRRALWLFSTLARLGRGDCGLLAHLGSSCIEI
jgi:hypothetical protein